MDPQTPTTSSERSGRPCGCKSACSCRYVEKANEYIDGVLSGAIPACKWVRLACQRQRDDLARLADDPVFYFDVAKASHACRFIERLPHIKGPAAKRRELIRLEPWQCFILTTVFGWRRRDTGGRRFRRVYVEVPRGNGKSILSSCIALYGLCADGEEGAEVYSAATTRDQAKFVWGVAQAMLLKRPDFAAKIGAVVTKKEILKPSTNGIFVPLSREAKNQDGANLHVGIVDELHAHRTREVYDVLETAMGKRVASLLFVITTAGVDTSGICYEVRSYVLKVLEQKVEDETVFGVVYTIDVEDDWADESSWIKANPNWGISVMPDEIAALAKKAMQLPSAASNFCTKHLDVWTNADQAWMDMRAWDACADAELSEADFVEDECFVGLDLATVNDIAAKVKLYRRELPVDRCKQCDAAEGDHPPATAEGAPTDAAAEPGCPGFEAVTERHYYGFLTSYLPAATVESSKNSQYRGWAEESRIKTTPGNVLDFSVVRDDILEDSRLGRIVEVCFDPWQSRQLAQELEAEGLVSVEVRNTVANFSAPMKEWDRLVRSRRFHHDADPVMRWMVSNVVAHLDAKENIYPRKERPENKIDGPVALISALCRAMVAVAAGGSYLETQPLVTL